MFLSVMRFELRYQLKTPAFLLGWLLFFLFAFGATASENVQIGARGNVYVNSPYAIVQTLGIMSVLAIFLVTAFVAGAVVRDEETRFAPLLRATRLTNDAYVWGRFTGAFTVAFLALAAVPCGILAGSLMPWVDPATVGPFVPAHYVLALLVYGLPTLLLVSSILFALATATRNLMWTCVGAVALLALYLVSRGWLRDPALDLQSALADPFGIAAFSKVTRYWTAAERNTLLPPLEGLLLWNRLLWSGIAAVFLALGRARFSLEERARPVRAGGDPVASVPAPAARGARFDRAGTPSALAQFLAIARFDAIGVLKSPTLFALLALGVLTSIGNLHYASQIYGVPVYPVTRAMIPALLGTFELIPLLIAIYYAGELVWRDRQLGMHEIVDATPSPDWAHLLPKIGAIVAVLLFAMGVAVLTAVCWQASQGYFRFELLHYLAWFVLPQLVTAVQTAVLAVFVQALVPNKMTGWAILLVYVVASIALGALGFEHNLYNIGSAPLVPLSDMNGQGHFWIGRTWFQAYWSAFSVALVVLAHALRNRGAGTPLAARLAQLPNRLRGAAGVWLTVALLAWAAIGGWIFHNTNRVNEYLPRELVEARQAEYEQTLLPFEALPQPRITEVELDVELYPHERRAVTRGSYLVRNDHAAALAEIHVAWPQNLELVELDAGGARIARDFGHLHYRIYTLDTLLEPGATRRIGFATVLANPGFRNDTGPKRLVDNGSFIDNAEIAPAFGPSREALLKDRAKRRKHGLPPELRMAKLEDESARAHTYVRADSDWVSARIRLTTDADQVPLAPGRILEDHTANGRRTLRTESEGPILHAFSLQSARYASRTRDHQGTALAVYYQPGHEYNVDRMLDAIGTSLDLFAREFGPYPFSHARIVEFPAYEDSAQAFAGTIPYSEGIGFILKPDLATDIDMVSYVTAHEIGHQWWAHQLIGADLQGSTMLTETFAQYSALLVMEHIHGKAQIRRFLKYELDRYLRDRGGELIEELPLARVENQPYIHYRKGSLVMYWLKEAVGEEAVNRALRALLAEYAFKAAPYPTTRDFLRLLRAEAGPAHDALITDLFERITLIDARSDAAVATRRTDGKWDVALTVSARKLVADGSGHETEEPLDEAIDIGVFAAEPGRPEFDDASVLAFARQRITSGTHTLHFVVDREPGFAGIDPYNMRIDRNSEDNVSKVTAEAGGE